MLLFLLLSGAKGGLRPILDLHPQPLPEEGEIQDAYTCPVFSVLDPEYWMVALGAYFHIPILQARRLCLWFMVGQEHFQFAVLPFCLTSAPRVFTKVMTVVAAHFRRSGIPVFPLPQRLAAEGGLATGSGHPSPDCGRPPAFTGVHWQHAEVTL